MADSPTSQFPNNLFNSSASLIPRQSDPSPGSPPCIGIVTNRHIHELRDLGVQVVVDRFQADLDALLSPVTDVGLGEFIDEARLRVLLDQFLS